MIGYLSGRVLDFNGETILMDVNGIGYEVHASGRTGEKLRRGHNAALFIFTHLRADGRSEGALELFGFSNLWEKKVFLALTSVSGVGFRTALGMLGVLAPEAVLNAIIRQDRATLTSAPGIGKKTAERLLVELSDKAQKLLSERSTLQKTAPLSLSTVGAPVEQTPVDDASSAAEAQGADDSSLEDPAMDMWQEAQEALVALGYRDTEAATALRQVFSENKSKDLTVQTFVTTALQRLSRARTL